MYLKQQVIDVQSKEFKVLKKVNTRLLLHTNYDDSKNN